MLNKNKYLVKILVISVVTATVSQATGLRLHSTPPPLLPAAPIHGAVSTGSINAPTATQAHSNLNESVSASLVSANAKIQQPTVPAPTPVAPPVSRSSHPQLIYHALLDPVGPLYSSEQFLSRLSSQAGWATASTSAQNPIIAVIDTGFALDHEALASRWAGTRGTPSWLGYDFVHNTNNPIAGQTDPTAAAATHGTLTAGLASLMDPSAKIMPLQALNDDGTGYTDAIGAAVRYAADNGARVISLSLGTSSDDSYLHAQIDYAISKGSIVVAAAGNDGCNCMLYPAAYPEVLSVGATDANDVRASFSSYGPNLGVMAPGTASDVCSSTYSPTNEVSGYSCGYQGTSFATPIVSGLAALVLDKFPNISNTQLISIIESSSDRLPAMGGNSRTDEYGSGRIDVFNALLLASSINNGGSPPPIPSIGSSQSAQGTGIVTDSVCTATPGATCDIKLIGPNGQVVALAGQIVTNNFGGAQINTNLQSLGLAVGSWLMQTTVVINGQATTFAPVPFTVN